MEKILDLDEKLNIHHGVIVVGEVGSGKSLIIDTLIQAKTQISQPIHRQTLYPQVMNIYQPCEKM